MPSLIATGDLYRRVKKLLADGKSCAEAGRAAGVSKSLAHRISRGPDEPPKPKIRRPHTGPRKPTVLEVLGPRSQTPGDPSPEEIAAACDKLRKYRHRDDDGDHYWTVPEVCIAR